MFLINRKNLETIDRHGWMVVGVFERFPRGAWFANAFEPDVLYRVLQLVWPDKKRLFPWDLSPGAPKTAGALPRQPLLCLPPADIARA